MAFSINSSILGAWTFFASAHAIDVCGINGLPLTPNSIRILGRFQKLKLLIHPNLCTYIDAQRGKHERVMVVCETYLDDLYNLKMQNSSNILSVFSKIAFETLQALHFLQENGIVHRCISPNNIRFNSEGNVKLSNFGLYYMTEGGSTVSFPIGSPKYIAPEVLANGLLDNHSTPKSDIWSLGIILLETILETEFWDEIPMEIMLQKLISLNKCDTASEVISNFLEWNNISNKFETIPENILSFFENCLVPNPVKRPEAHQLLLHPLFENLTNCSENMNAGIPAFLSTKLRCMELSANDPHFLVTVDISSRPLQELYYLWQLAGGDLETELRRQELIRAKPPVLSISKVVSGEGEEFGQKKDRAYLFDDSISHLPIEPLKHRLRDVDPVVYYPLIEYSLNGHCVSSYINTIKETAKLPLIIKEKDVEYQLSRIILFKRLLEAYPYRRAQINQEAKLDIPPLYRPLVWAALLEIEGNIEATYGDIDKETPTPTDRQIEVDIPRCHQYDELLSSPVGHQKFKRILKAWVVSHPQYVYWQGLDSLCAPFLSLNFNNEALAYACLSAFIPKYLYNFFLKDNSAVIQEYLAKFSHLIAFHDPELTNHLENIGFIPELYAIPWFLTMYTHVFPLHKIFHLWDTLLLGDSSFPLCIGVAILKQLRNNLLSYGFNECILMFSDMPEIDIQRCVQTSIRVFCSTPKSITYRVHEISTYSLRNPVGRKSQFNKPNYNTKDELMMSPIPIHELKSEISPRISAQDLLDLLPSSPNKSHSDKLLAIDIRPSEEYCKGALEHSINIPFPSHEQEDSKTLGQEYILNTPGISNHKGKIISIIGSNKDNSCIKFADKLVKLGFSRVCTLHGGIEVLRKTGLLIAKTSEN